MAGADQPAPPLEGLGAADGRAEGGDLAAPVPAERPAQLVAGHQPAQAGVERADVVEVEVDLDEDLPVEGVVLDRHPLAPVAGEVEVVAQRPALQVLQQPPAVLGAAEDEVVPGPGGVAAQPVAGGRVHARRVAQRPVEAVAPRVDRAAQLPPEAPAAVEEAGLAVRADVVEQRQPPVVVHEHQVVERRVPPSSRPARRPPAGGPRSGTARPARPGSPRRPSRDRRRRPGAGSRAHHDTRRPWLRRGRRELGGCALGPTAGPGRSCRAVPRLVTG